MSALVRRFRERRLRLGRDGLALEGRKPVRGGPSPSAVAPLGLRSLR